MFEITDFTEARIASVTNRTEAHGEERVPAVSVGLEFEFENTRLDLIDPTLRHALYKPKPDAEPELPGVEQSTPVLRSNSIDRVKLITAHEGWTLKVDDNIDAEDPLVFGGCKVDQFSVEPKQGGTIVLRVRVGTSDVDAERLGYLGVNNGQAVWVQLLKPEKAPDKPVIDGTVGHPGAAAAAAGQGSLLDTETPEGALAAAVGADAENIPQNIPADSQASGAVCEVAQVGKSGPDDDTERRDDDEGSHPDGGAAEPARGENWPFPTGGSEKSDEQRSAERLTAERDQAEFEAGAAQAIAAAGVKPKRRAKAATEVH